MVSRWFSAWSPMSCPGCSSCFVFPRCQWANDGFYFRGVRVFRTDAQCAIRKRDRRAGRNIVLLAAAVPYRLRASHNPAFGDDNAAGCRDRAFARGNGVPWAAPGCELCHALATGEKRSITGRTFGGGSLCDRQYYNRCARDFLVQHHRQHTSRPDSVAQYGHNAPPTKASRRRFLASGTGPIGLALPSFCRCF